MQAAMRIRMPLADVLEQSAQSDFELIDGESRPKSPPVYGQSRIVRLIVRLLDTCMNGVRLVWVIDGQGKRVLVFEPDAESVRTLKGDAPLTADDMLPDFSLKLSDLFA